MSKKKSVIPEDADVESYPLTLEFKRVGNAPMTKEPIWKLKKHAFNESAWLHLIGTTHDILLREHDIPKYRMIAEMHNITLCIEGENDTGECSHPDGFNSYDPVEDSHFCPHCGVGRG